jgi:phage portal protein BeeE
MITAQFCESGNAKQAEIARAFGVPPISVKRAVKLYRKLRAPDLLLVRFASAP